MIRYAVVQIVPIKYLQDHPQAVVWYTFDDIVDAEKYRERVLMNGSVPTENLTVVQYKDLA